MKTVVVGILTLGVAGCMLRREARLPAPIPPVSGDRGEFEVEMKYVDFVKGTGATMAPRKCVYAHYTGWLPDGTKFDSSHDTLPNGEPRGPFSFNQGLRRVIMGWEMGFDGMRVGGKRRLFVPFQLAYGEAGRPPQIPARATLIFDVELLALADTLPTASAPRPQGGGRGGAPVAICPAWDSLRPAGER